MIGAMSYLDSDIQTDTMLILCIEECDNKSEENAIDNRVFIGWSITDKDFFIRGKRQNFGKCEYAPYAFRTKNIDSLYDFLEFVIGCRSNASVKLYNYNNVVNWDPDEITYDFLEQYLDANYEIAGYDNINIDYVRITRLLKMVKTCYNWDNDNVN